MYTFGPPVLVLGFAATLKTETFQAKVFTEEAPQVAFGKAIAAKRSKDGVFSVEKSRDRCDMRNVHTRQNRGLCATFFSMAKPGSGQQYAHEFSGESPFDVLD
jgi:hypothetical protein